MFTRKSRDYSYTHVTVSFDTWSTHEDTIKDLEGLHLNALGRNTKARVSTHHVNVTDLKLNVQE